LLCNQISADPLNETASTYRPFFLGPGRILTTFFDDTEVSGLSSEDGSAVDADAIDSGGPVVLVVEVGEGAVVGIVVAFTTFAELINGRRVEPALQIIQLILYRR
jgi:hypothetical protein